MAIGEIATRVEVVQNTRGSQSSAGANVDINDRARSNEQESSVQLDNRTDGNELEVQSQRTNIASYISSLV